MSKNLSRKQFIKASAITGVAFLGAPFFERLYAGTLAANDADLYRLSQNLCEEWAETLLHLQITDKASPDYGGITSPATGEVHGRVGDTIYPFMYLAQYKKDKRYSDAALLLYDWMEKHVSQPDGSWLNEPKKGSWKGTTVFATIALTETLKSYAPLLTAEFRTRLTARLQKAGDFIYNTIDIEYGNINYPINASYCLALLGEVLNIKRYSTRGRELARQALKSFTNTDHFISGEGEPRYEASKKGCFAIDLGYNVEESLPALALYGLLTKDEEILTAVTRAMQTHMEFMLPDGGWDNSWGTRNYKWTYWGSRTSDGCQPAYALLAHRDPRFYMVALKNTQLLKRCTTNGLLTGGPHYTSHNITPSVHHTFCHIKALVAVLESKDRYLPANINSIKLPRELAYGSRLFADIQTWLIAKGDYTATVTGYDREYKKTHAGHPSGGALSMLWHPRTGPILAASMTEYQLFEVDNMQPDNDPNSMCLTPRIQLKVGDVMYTNINNLEAKIEINQYGQTLHVDTYAKLVDKNQQDPASGAINCRVTYEFSNNKVVLKFSYAGQVSGLPLQVIVPVISKSAEMVKLDGKQMNIVKGRAMLRIHTNQTITVLPTTGNRIFNFVPGLEAIPLVFYGNNVVAELSVV